jgi:hypothetical protein
MYTKEEYYARQPIFGDTITKDMTAFDRIKDYGMFKEGLLICMIDMALFEIDQRVSLYVSMDAVLTEIEKSAYSNHPRLAAQMQEFVGHM